jgi:hypothetical protein
VFQVRPGLLLGRVGEVGLGIVRGRRVELVVLGEGTGDKGERVGPTRAEFAGRGGRAVLMQQQLQAALEGRETRMLWDDCVLLKGMRNDYTFDESLTVLFAPRMSG